MAVAAPMVPARAQGAENLSRKQQIDESAKKIKELQQERIVTLEEAVAQITVLFQNGRVEFDEAIDAQLLLLDAKLEFAEKDSDRIAIYEKMLAVLKGYEQWAGARVQSAHGTGAAALKIKARRLEAEIRLEQAKAKQAQESK
jgi:hypothetical protein